MDTKRRYLVVINHIYRKGFHDETDEHFKTNRSNISHYRHRYFPI